jgi:UDP-2,4-diacetamido-2,4,6-trideoxy-beta-L-altropyranose hydrolase
MNVVIRADASRVIGSGHVMRTLTLARSLRDRAADVSFITRRHPGNLIPLVQTHGFRVLSLAAPQWDVLPLPDPAHAAWVGATWKDDAAETFAAIREFGTTPDWLIVDHYGLDERWEAELRPSVRRILVIDDLADRRHDCDLLLDQNLVENFENRYLGKLPEGCPSMLGPRYALLQPDFARLHDQVEPRAGPIRRLFIYFGSAHRSSLTELAVRAFLKLERADIDADVVVSGDVSAAESIGARIGKHANVHVHAQLASLAPLMAQADFAIGAAGSTSWERMCLGLPALVITLAENQTALARALHDQGFATWLGHAGDVGLSDLQRALAERIELGSDEVSSRAGHAAVDGGGVRRVAAALWASADMPLAIRRATAADEALLLEWANDRETRRNSFGRESIGVSEHHEWLRARLQSAETCRILIVESGERVPLGMARFERSGLTWTVNYSVATPFRGRGLARPMLELALSQLAGSDASWVRGRVMQSNAASHRVFRRLGFEVVSDADGTVEYRRAL